MTPWARLIQKSGIVPEPGEDLLTCRCFGLLEAVRQPPHLQDIVLAGLLVLQGMELVNSPVLDLSELAISRRTRYKGTHSIHHKSITLLIACRAESPSPRTSRRRHCSLVASCRIHRAHANLMD